MREFLRRALGVTLVLVAALIVILVAAGAAFGETLVIRLLCAGLALWLGYRTWRLGQGVARAWSGDPDSPA